MPWKLLVFIFIMCVVVVFIGFNLDNRCDISVVFVTLRNVPVVLTILASFILGLLSAIFLTFRRKKDDIPKASKKLSSTKAIDNVANTNSVPSVTQSDDTVKQDNPVSADSDKISR